MNRKVVAITGGSRGVGLATITELLKNGYDIFTCSRKPSDQIKSIVNEYGEKRVCWIACSVGIEDEEIAYFSELKEWLDGRYLWGLVNNAGVAGEGILATFPTCDIGNIIQINLLGALRLSRLACQIMLRQKSGGRIINISSILGQRGYNGLAAYAASKSGMDGFTRSLSRELGRRKITVNSIAPGYLETDISASLSSSQLTQIIRRTPIGELSSVQDIANMTNFLLSDKASSITGQIIVIDGGLTA